MFKYYIPNPNLFLMQHRLKCTWYWSSTLALAQLVSTFVWFKNMPEIYVTLRITGTGITLAWWYPTDVICLNTQQLSWFVLCNCSAWPLLFIVPKGPINYLYYTSLANSQWHSQLMQNNEVHTKHNWRERAAFQRSAFGRSTAGNDEVATFLIRLFFSPFFSAVTFSQRRSAKVA